MANWSRKKVFRLAKGFRGRGGKSFGLALRGVYKQQQYVYRDRRAKKRIVRRDWVQEISRGVRQAGLNYSRFMNSMRKSNILIDRKILADLSVNEPYSFRSVVQEVNSQVSVVDKLKRNPRYMKTIGMSMDKAFETNFLE